MIIHPPRHRSACPSVPGLLKMAFRLGRNERSFEAYSVPVRREAERCENDAWSSARPGAPGGRVTRAHFQQPRQAEVAELADALDSGSSARKGVRVQIPASAPNLSF